MSHNPADRGSAALEFIAGALVLLIPCIYAILSLSSVETATLAVESAARNAARLFVDQTSPEAGRAVARDAARDALSALHNVGPTQQIRITCQSGCEGPGGIVTVTVSARVALPLLPQWPATRFLSSIPVVASAAQSSARFGAIP